MPWKVVELMAKKKLANLKSIIMEMSSKDMKRDSGKKEMMSESKEYMKGGANMAKKKGNKGGKKGC